MVDFLRDRIATYKLPEFLQIMENLPRTPTGKVQKGPPQGHRSGTARRRDRLANRDIGTSGKGRRLMRLIDMHSHWKTRRGYVFQTEAELAFQQHTFRSEPEYATEEEMAEDFRRAGVETILDFGFTKYIPVAEARELHDYGFDTQRRFSDVILGNWLHFQPEIGHRGAGRIQALSGGRLRICRPCGFGLRRRSRQRPGLSAVLRCLHRGQCSGAHFRRNDRARRRPAGRQRDRAG